MARRGTIIYTGLGGGAVTANIAQLSLTNSLNSPSIVGAVLPITFDTDNIPIDPTYFNFILGTSDIEIVRDCRVAMEVPYSAFAKAPGPGNATLIFQFYRDQGAGFLPIGDHLSSTVAETGGFYAGNNRVPAIDLNAGDKIRWTAIRFAGALDGVLVATTYTLGINIIKLN